MGQEQERAGGRSGVPVKERWAGGQQLARCQEPSPAPPPPPAQAVWSQSPPATDALSSPSQPPPPLVPPAPTASRVARTGTAPGGRASCEVPMTRDPMMTGRCRRHGSGGAAISSHGAKRRKAKRMGGRPSIWPATTRGRHTSVPDIPLRCQWHTAPPLVHPVGKLPLSQQWQWSRRVARHGDVNHPVVTVAAAVVPLHPPRRGFTPRTAPATPPSDLPHQRRPLWLAVCL